MRRLLIVISVALVTLALFGCSDNGDYPARFLRYDTLQDGSRVAVVYPTAAGAEEEQLAYTNLTDLRPGEVVIVRWSGRSWETPQWKPDREVIGR